MCRFKIYHYDCGHSKRLLKGAACPRARYHGYSNPIPFFCPAAQLQHITVPGDCRKENVLIACQVLPRLDDIQRRVLAACDRPIRSLQIKALDTTRRILIALAQWSGGEFHPRNYAPGLQTVWRSGDLSAYTDHLTMMDAAYYATMQMHCLLSSIYALCQQHILSGFHNIPHRDVQLKPPAAVDALANVILMPVRNWAITAIPQLEGIASSIEGSGEMMKVAAARGDGRYKDLLGFGRDTAHFVSTMILPVRSIDQVRNRDFQDDPTQRTSFGVRQGLFAIDQTTQRPIAVSLTQTALED